MEDYNEKSYQAVIARFDTKLDNFESKLDNFENRLENIDNRLAGLSKEIKQTGVDIQNTFSTKITDTDVRLKVLEHFKYWLLGATAGFAVIFNLIFPVVLPKLKAIFALF